jgi:hypothetical protein
VAISSADVNRVFRRVLYPALREAGFTKFKGRCAWRYGEDWLWALQIREVGNHFGSVTGFPPMSLCGELGIFFPDFPSPDPSRPDSKPPRDSDGLDMPKPPQCQVRYPLQVQLDQSPDRAALLTQSERDRDDVWYVRPDGSNIEAVIEDVRRSVIEWGIPLLQKPYNTRAEQIRRRGLDSAARA